MALQSSLRLEQIQMVGPGSDLVRQYRFGYELGPTTQRTRLTQVEECAGDGVCKPPTRFQYSSSAPGFEKQATNLPTPISRQASPMVLDANGDGLSDLVLPDVDKALSTPGNPITQWSIARSHGVLSGSAQAFSEDWVFVDDPSGDPAPEFGTALDYDQDGRTDILLHDVHGASANWLVLLSRPGDTFELHDTGIARPFPLHATPPMLTSVGASMHLADVNGDMNAHDPEDPGVVPNVEITYGHLRDAWITRGEKPGDPERDKDLYLSQDDAKNECVYPRRCVVGPRRVVSGYALNNGADTLRHFELRYRDGRYHRLGRGFLGFGERIVRDLETGEVTSELYDNITYDDHFTAFPFAGQLVRQERLQPGLKLERSQLDITRTLVPGDATYFTLLTQQRVRHEQGALVLRDITTRVTDFDEFGHVLAEEMSAAGVDLTFQIERSFKNDTERWILGQLETQKACSAAVGISQCRQLTTRWTDPNQLVTERRYDGFGRLGLEIRPDGSQTSITLSRSKEDRWRVRARSVTTGGADDTVECDSRGRPIRWLWHGPDMGNSPRSAARSATRRRGKR